MIFLFLKQKKKKKRYIVTFYFQINGAASTAQRTDLSAGIYSIIAYDANNCPSASHFVELGQLDGVFIQF